MSPLFCDSLHLGWSLYGIGPRHPDPLGWGGGYPGSCGPQWRLPLGGSFGSGGLSSLLFFSFPRLSLLLGDLFSLLFSEPLSSRLLLRLLLLLLDLRFESRFFFGLCWPSSRREPEAAGADAVASTTPGVSGDVSGGISVFTSWWGASSLWARGCWGGGSGAALGVSPFGSGVGVSAGGAGGGTSGGTSGAWGGGVWERGGAGPLSPAAGPLGTWVATCHRVSSSRNSASASLSRRPAVVTQPPTGLPSRMRPNSRGRQKQMEQPQEVACPHIYAEKASAAVRKITDLMFIPVSVRYICILYIYTITNHPKPCGVVLR